MPPQQGVVCRRSCRLAGRGRCVLDIVELSFSCWFHSVRVWVFWVFFAGVLFGNVLSLLDAAGMAGSSFCLFRKRLWNPP